ncbi:MAG: hypothetical protein CMP11_04130 [Zetaproteobacteria bacterium]|nr:hypothetical protein [Pseudobdellovibrionaceae bacterium]|tara:strand:+ start:142 stop:1215 length:1074 start_codon:yes stop_codon:yes gene_type:complete
MKKKKVAIIGQGVVGLFSAYRLSEKGFQVTVFGEDSLSSCASSAAMGCLCLKGAVQPKDSLFQEKMFGVNYLRSFLFFLQEETGLSIPVVQTGVCEPFLDKEHYSFLRKRLFQSDFTGFKRIIPLTAEEVLARFPALCLLKNYHRYMGAFFYPDDLWFDPRAFLRVFQSFLARRGVVFVTQKVLKVVSSQQGLLLSPSSALGSFGEVVVCSGQGSVELVRESCGFTPSFSATRGETLVMGLSGNQAQGIHTFGKTSLCFNGQQVTFGSSSRGGVGKEMFPRDLFTLAKSFMALEPETVEVYSGVRLRTKSRMPLLEKYNLTCGQGRLWLLSGFHRSGYSLASVYSERLVEKLLAAPF